MYPRASQFLIAAAIFALSVFSVAGIPDQARAGNVTFVAPNVVAIEEPSRKKSSFRLSSSQRKKIERAKDYGRSKVFAEILVARLVKLGLTKGGSKAVSRMARQLGKSWCGPCKSRNGVLVRKLSISGPEFKDGISAFITADF